MTEDRYYGSFTEKRNLSAVGVLSTLGCYLRHGDGNPVHPSLIGAKIVRFGAPDVDCGLEGGGLVIDYIPENETQQRRLVFAFNELGMCVEDMPVAENKPATNQSESLAVGVSD